MIMQDMPPEIQEYYRQDAEKQLEELSKREKALKAELRSVRSQIDWFETLLTSLTRSENSKKEKHDELMFYAHSYDHTSQPLNDNLLYGLKDYPFLGSWSDKIKYIVYNTPVFSPSGRVMTTAEIIEVIYAIEHTEEDVKNMKSKIAPVVSRLTSDGELIRVMREDTKDSCYLSRDWFIDDPHKLDVRKEFSPYIKGVIFPIDF